MNLQFSRNRVLVLFALPAMVIYTLFFILPIGGNLWISLVQWNGGIDSDMVFCGLDNYLRLFNPDEAFLAALLHNVVYMLTVVSLQLLLALGFALILARPIRGQNLFKTIFLLPVVLSGVTLALVWSYMYDPMQGFINALLGAVGLGSLVQSWLGDQNLVLFSVAFVNAWQYVGYSMIIFIAGLQTIPESLYEASAIDGSGLFNTFRHVTLPLLAPAITINVVLSTTGCFKVFDLIFIMTPPGGPISYATEVLSTLMYKQGFTFGEFGYSAAIANMLLLIIMVIGFVQTKVLRSREVEY